MKVVQVWKCPDCGSEYKAPISIREASCHKTESHKTRTTKVMKLVEGSPLQERTGSTVKAKGGQR